MSVKKLLGAAVWKGVLLAILTLLLLLGAAALMLQRGLVPESAAPTMVCVSYAAAVLVGGRSAVRSGNAPPMLQSLTVAACLYAAVWLIALSGDTDFTAHGLQLTAGVFGGALLAGLPGRRRGKRQSGPRRAREKPRRAIVQRR